MKGLILNRNKYIIERSRYYSNIKRISIFVGIVFMVVAIASLSAGNISNTTSMGGSITNPVQYNGNAENKSLENGTELDLGEQKQINDERKTNEISIIKKDIPENYYVTKVVDGDTIYVSGIDTRIRLIGIDTPETVSSSEPVQCYGPEASDYLKNLILGKYVGLESDAASGDTDKYGRPLRYVYYNGENVNQKILLEGYGKEASYGSDYKYHLQFIESEQNAIANNKGLWSPSTCNGRE